MSYSCVPPSASLDTSHLSLVCLSVNKNLRIQDITQTVRTFWDPHPRGNTTTYKFFAPVNMLPFCTRLTSLYVIVIWYVPIDLMFWEKRQESIPVGCVATAEVASTLGGGGFRVSLAPCPFSNYNNNFTAIVTVIKVLDSKLPYPLDTLTPPPTWDQGYPTPICGETNTCENITFPPLHWWSVMIKTNSEYGWRNATYY